MRNDFALGLAALTIVAALLRPATAACETSKYVDLAVTPAPTALLGANSSDRLGQEFAVGDFNGDGFRDLAVLAAGTTADNLHPPFLTILLGPWGLSGDVDMAVYTGPIATIRAVPGDAGTRATVVAGDFNGDGIDDIALGVPNNSQATDYSGKIYVVYGTPAVQSGMTISLDNPAVPATVYVPDPASAGWLGAAMASGDVNNDGIDELLVSAPYRAPGGRVYIVYGQSAPPSSADLDTLSTHVTRIVESDWYQAFGASLDCCDSNGDGFDDVLVGAPGDGVAPPGMAFMVMGAGAMPTTLSISYLAPGVLRFFGESSYDGFGSRVRLADVNGDGHADAVISAPYADPLGCTDCGEVYAVYWDSSLPDSLEMTNPDVHTTRLLGSGSSEEYGVRMTTGNFDSDVAADIVLKREPDDFTANDRRTVVIVHGAPTLPDTIFLSTDTTATRIVAEQPGDNLGLGLALSDLDGDGIGDLCIGAPWTNVGTRNFAGKVHIFYGCATVSAVSQTRATRIPLRIYPNPFNPEATVSFSITSGAHVRVDIFDVHGALVRNLVNEWRPASTYRVRWDGRDNRGVRVSSGVFLCRLVAGRTRATKKVTMLK